MARTHFAPLLHQLCQTVHRLDADHLSDGQLLERFAQGHEEDAFAALVHRHGALVLGACRRVLSSNQDAEDVFQATFLGLARQAASIRQPDSLAGWLYRVAYRLAVKVHRGAERRQTVPLDDVSEPVGRAQPWREFLAVLDEELHALPEKNRLALVLCYLEGQTRDQAARQLGWSRRTLLRRLEEGRQRLRERLARHGVTLPAALLTLGLVQPARAAVPLELARQTVRTAILIATGSELATQIVPAHVMGLAKGGLQTMTKFKIALALLMAFGAIGWGAGSYHHPAQAADPPPETVKPPLAAKARPAPPRISESVWADLANPERARVTRALMTLGAAPPSEAVAFLKKRLHPVKDDPERAPRLIADLDSKELAKRQTAAEELEYLGKFAVPYLKSALAAKPALEMHKRIEQILARVQPPARVQSFPGINGLGGYLPNRGLGMMGGIGGGMGMMGGGMGMMGGGMGMMGGGMGMMGGGMGMMGGGMGMMGGMGGKTKQPGVLPKGDSKPMPKGGSQPVPNGATLQQQPLQPGAIQNRPNFNNLLQQLPNQPGGFFQQQIPLQPGGMFGQIGPSIKHTPPPPPAVWLRAVWSIAVLEQIGTPEARKVVEELAKGAADALPTKEAKAALARWAKR